MTRRSSDTRAAGRGRRKGAQKERVEGERWVQTARSDPEDDDLLRTAWEQPSEVRRSGHGRTNKSKREKARFTDAPILPEICDFRLELSEDHANCSLFLITNGECTEELAQAARKALRPWLPSAPVVEKIELVKQPVGGVQDEDQPDLPFHERPIRELVTAIVRIFHNPRLERCGKRCVRSMPRITMLEGDDLVQEAYILLIRGGLHWRGSLEKLIASLLTTIYQLSWNYKRFERNKDSLGDHDYTRPQDWRNADWTAWVTLLNGDLEEALAILPPAQREVLIMRYFLGMTPKRIADELDKSVQTVNNHLAEGKKRILESGMLDAYRQDGQEVSV